MQTQVSNEALTLSIRRTLLRKQNAEARPSARTHEHDGWPGEVEDTSHGPLRIIRREFPTSHTHGDAPLASALQACSEAIARFSLDPGLADVSVNDMLFIDTETTGLAGGMGTIPFLIGAAYFEGGQLQLEQWLLEEPGREAPLLRALAHRMRQRRCLVTYNGKSYDWPLLRNRFVLNRIAAISPARHLDLVHGARRLFKRRLKNVRLIDLEERVLGFKRQNDVAGALIPRLYWQAVRTGRPGKLAAVVEHNRWDLLALVALLGVVAKALAEPDDATSLPLGDRIGVAEVLFRTGQLDVACTTALQVALKAADTPAERPTAAHAFTLAADSARRTGNVTQAAHYLERALAYASPEQTPGLRLNLAKLCEHRLRDPGRAMQHAAQAREAESADDHQRRLTRLEKKTTRMNPQARRSCISTETAMEPRTENQRRIP